MNSLSIFVFIAIGMNKGYFKTNKIILNLNHLNFHYLARINAQGMAVSEPSPKVGFIWLAKFNDCEGKDSANYTGVQTLETDA